METHNHAVLKILGVRWLYEIKCKYIATEVKIGKYIYDVVGSDGKRVFVIEAKQDYNDFLKDCNKPEELKQQISELKEDAILSSDIKKYRKKVKKIREKSIKFYDKAITKLSTHRYIIAPDHLLNNNEVPEGWGLINEDINVKIKCEGNRIDSRYCDRVINDIARRNTKLFLESLGVNFEQKQIEWPNTILV